MSDYITTFIKSYSFKDKRYRYYINGIEVFSSENLTEPEVSQLLYKIDEYKDYVE